MQQSNFREEKTRGSSLGILLQGDGGFTLVEILVSIFIIALLSGIIFANYRSSGQQFVLQGAANKLAQDIRRVQQMAMSAEETNLGGQVPAGQEFVPEGGYGIYFEEISPNSYIIFADCGDTPNRQYNGSGLVCGPANSEYTEHIETIELEQGVNINNIQKEGGGAPDKIHITFVSPDPEVHIVPPAGAGGEPAWCEIILALTANPSKTKTIKVNKAGLIEVE